MLIWYNFHESPSNYSYGNGIVKRTKANPYFQSFFLHKQSIYPEFSQWQHEVITWNNEWSWSTNHLGQMRAKACVQQTFLDCPLGAILWPDMEPFPSGALGFNREGRYENKQLLYKWQGPHRDTCKGQWSSEGGVSLPSWPGSPDEGLCPWTMYCFVNFPLPASPIDSRTGWWSSTFCLHCSKATTCKCSRVRDFLKEQLLSPVFPFS